MWQAAWLWVVIAAASIGAFPDSWGIGLFQAKNAVFIVGALGLVIWQVQNWLLRAFLAWAVVSFAAAGATAWAMAGLLGLFAWSLVYAEAAKLSWHAWAWLRWPVAAAAVFQVGWMLMQAAGYDPLFTPITIYGAPMIGAAPEIVGWFGNQHDAALFLGLCLPFLSSIHWGLGAAVSAAIVLGLRATIGIVLVGIAWAWWFGPRRWWLSASIGISSGLIWMAYFDQQGFLAGKWLVWQQSWHLALLSPWVGWGPNAVDYRVQFYQPAIASRWNFVFQEWLQGALEVGLVGASIALLYAVGLGWRVRRHWRRCGELLPGAAMVFAASLFSIPFRVGPAACLAALYLGRLDAETRPLLEEAQR